MFIFTLAHCKFFNHFNIFFSKDAYVFLEAYGPSLQFFQEFPELPTVLPISWIKKRSPEFLMF